MVSVVVSRDLSHSHPRFIRFTVVVNTTHSLVRLVLRRCFCHKYGGLGEFNDKALKVIYDLVVEVENRNIFFIFIVNTERKKRKGVQWENPGKIFKWTLLVPLYLIYVYFFL